MGASDMGASDMGGEAEMQAPMRMRPQPPTTPAKIKTTELSRHAHAAAELAGVESVPLASRDSPEAHPIKEGT